MYCFVENLFCIYIYIFLYLKFWTFPVRISCHIYYQIYYIFLFLDFVIIYFLFVLRVVVKDLDLFYLFVFVAEFCLVLSRLIEFIPHSTFLNIHTAIFCSVGYLINMNISKNKSVRKLNEVD